MTDSIKPITVTDSTFKKEVLNADIPVLVDFWAPWCVPCKSVAPVIEELAIDYNGKAKICKLDTESNRNIPGILNIKSIPTILIFYKGEVKDVLIGARGKSSFTKALDSILKKIS